MFTEGFAYQKDHYHFFIIGALVTIDSFLELFVSIFSEICKSDSKEMPLIFVEYFELSQ